MFYFSNENDKIIENIWEMKSYAFLVLIAHKKMEYYEN